MKKFHILIFFFLLSSLAYGGGEAGLFVPILGTADNPCTATYGTATFLLADMPNGMESQSNLCQNTSHGSLGYIGSYVWLDASGEDCFNAEVHAANFFDTLNFPSGSYYGMFADQNYTYFSVVVCGNTDFTPDQENISPRNESECGGGSVGGVTPGQEQAAAIAACRTYANNVGYPDALTGEVRTSGSLETSFTSTLDSTNTTAIVTYTCCKRGGYQPAGGTVVPIGALAGGGSTLSGGDVQTAMTNALSTAHANGWIGPGGSGGGGASASDISAIMNPSSSVGFTAPSAPGLTDYALDDTTLSSIRDAFVSAFTGTSSYHGLHASGTRHQESGGTSGPFGSFFDDAKSTGLGGLIGSYFGGIPGGTLGTPPVIVIHGGTTFGGDHNFDFAVFNPYMTLIKSIVLIIFGYVSIRVIIAKGG